MKKAHNHPTISIDEIVRPTQLEVHLGKLKDNFHSIKKQVGKSKIMAVLKANAYGHGLIRIAQLMQEIRADYLGVAVVEEGILLREYGIKIPILVMGGVWGNQVPLFLKNELTITASSIEKINQINETAIKLNIKAKVHIKIDTGMERIGIHYYNAEKLLEASLKCKNVIVEGIYSHFANADSKDLTHTKLQFERFSEVLSFYDKKSLPFPIRHISNSGGILQMPEANLDMVRPGILLYGVYPSLKIPKIVIVNPALNWKSLVIYFKVITPNHPVGYGLTWKTDKQVRAVTIPVGYGDGYFRNLSNKSEVIIRGKRYPVIGIISMDQLVVNIDNDSAYNGDEVILLGSDGNISITCEELAEWAGTIPYEVLTNINTRVPRVYID
ncbi:MAG TPA: alanine racemase [Ignavibacteriaceae bacterium]|nr:alanine racemase [Ignavibacteriaceae bacterium]